MRLLLISHGLYEQPHDDVVALLHSIWCWCCCKVQSKPVFWCIYHHHMYATYLCAMHVLTFTFGWKWMQSASCSTRISNELGAGNPSVARLSVKAVMFLAHRGSDCEHNTFFLPFCLRICLQRWKGSWGLYQRNGSSALSLGYNGYLTSCTFWSAPHLLIMNYLCFRSDLSKNWLITSCFMYDIKL